MHVFASIKNMSSLPQGWHGIPGPCKTSTSSSVGVSGTSVPVTIRKKWNSPQASNIPQTKLPSHRSSNLRNQNFMLNTTYQMKSPSTPPTTQQTKLPTPTKPSPVKEYKNEIEKLKKELSMVKAENSILKAKVRRVDDENIQKGRQIEKMRIEIKASQKNESGSSKKTKESQELFSLRQKCLRLETALREKDLVIKKLTSEYMMIKKEDSENSKANIQSIQKQIYRVTPTGQIKNSNKNDEKESVATKSSQSRASLSLKTEVTKLRDMIHKLEKENQDLQQQAKLHCQEIRRLKVQLKSKDKLTPQSSISKSSKTEIVQNAKTKPVSIKTNSQAELQTKIISQNSLVSNSVKQKAMKNTTLSVQNLVPASKKHLLPQKSNLQKSVPKNGKMLTLPNGNIKQISSLKQVKSIHSKLPITKSTVPFTASKPLVQKSGTNKVVVTGKRKISDIELKVKELRENIAAKKIQRSWRQHQKCLHHSPEPEFHNEGKALTFIISSMKHHKSRKAKLNLLVKKRRNLPEAIKKEAFMNTIESVAQKVWNEDHGSS